MSRGGEADRRRHRRIALRTRVDLVLDGESSFVSESAVDVSEGGMFIATAHPWPLGTVFSFGMRPRRGLAPVRGRAQVVWIRRGDDEAQASGMGVQFLDLSDEDRETIRTLRVFEAEEEGEDRSLAFDSGLEPLLPLTPTPELRTQSDVFPPPGETGIGFFDVQAEAARRAEERAHRRSNKGRRGWWIVLVMAVVVVAAGAWLTLRSGLAPSLRAGNRDSVEPSGQGPGLGLDLADPEIRSSASPAGLPPAVPPVTAVQEIDCASEGRRALVVITGNGHFLEHQVRHDRLSSPPRFVLRLLGIAEPFVGSVAAAERVPQISGIRVGHHPELDIPQLYVVLDLASETIEVLPPEIADFRLVVSVVERGPDPTRETATDLDSSPPETQPSDPARKPDPMREVVAPEPTPRP